MRPDGVVYTSNVYQVYGSGFANGIGPTTTGRLSQNSMFKYQTRANADARWEEDSTPLSQVPENSYGSVGGASVQIHRLFARPSATGWLYFYAKSASGAARGIIDVYQCPVANAAGRPVFNLAHRFTYPGANGLIRGVVYVTLKEPVQIFWSGVSFSEFSFLILRPRFALQPPARRQNDVYRLNGTDFESGFDPYPDLDMNRSV